MGLLVPELNDFPSSLVTVCATAVTFFHVTVVPTLIVNVVGLKAKDPLLSFVIMTTDPLPEAELAGVFVAAGVVALPLLLPLVEVVPPQADKSIIIVNATTDNHAHMCCLRVGIIHVVMFEFVRIVCSSF
jgi:hypothetical protein